MAERPSYSSSLAGALALTAVLAGVGDVVAQSEGNALCAGAPFPGECSVAAAAISLVHPRVGLALWGGNPIPGTAGTAGFRIGRTPRISAAGRVALVPAALPPLLDRGAPLTRTATVTALSLQSSMALVHGASPLPTVGGVFAMDIIARITAARVPPGRGFQRGDVWGVSGGLRLGLLRESFTLPGASLTALYGRSTTVTFGDPSGVSTDGYVRGAVSGLRVTGAVSRRLLGMRLSGGASWDRYTTVAQAGYVGLPTSGPGSAVEGDMVMTRWSGFGSMTWTRLIYHTTLEIGWQAPPELPTLPAPIEVKPMTWWAGLAFRVTP